MEEDPQGWPPLMRTSQEGRDILIVPLGLGLQGEAGVIVAGSERADYKPLSNNTILFALYRIDYSTPAR